MNAIRACVVAAAHAGLDPSETAALFGVDPAAVADPDARVSTEIAYQGWELVARRLGDPHFGLHAAEAIHAMLFDAYDFAVTSATTLREGIESMARHLRVQHEGAELRLKIVGGEAQVSVRFTPPEAVPRHFCEACVAVWVLRARALLDRPFVPRRVSFRHGAPVNLAEHLRVLGTAPVYGAAENVVAFDEALLDTPLSSADPTLRRVMDNHLDSRDVGASEWSSFTARTRAEIRGALREARPTLGQVAGRMGVSTRSLQRRLGEAGTSFNALLDEARRDLALEWIGDRRRTFKQIASDLGFVQTTALTRACRRWTGRSPSTLRAEARTRDDDLG